MRWAAIWVVVAACGGDGGGHDGFFSDAEWAEIQLLSPLPEVAADSTNRVQKDPRAAKLGQALYWDKRIQAVPLQVGKTTVDPTVMPPLAPNPSALGEAGDLGKVACASCHEPGSWYSDSHSTPRNVSLGIRYTMRNDPALVDAVFYNEYSWAGQADRLWTFITTTPEQPVGGTRLGVVHLLRDHYRDAYEAIFGALPAETADLGRFPAQARPPFSAQERLTAVTQAFVDAWNGMSAPDQQTANVIYVNACKSIAAYVTLLISRNAPFDRYVAGDATAISTAAKRGLRLFIGKANCVACHAGPFFSDEKYHVTGAPQTGDNVPAMDLGRYNVLTIYAAGVPIFSGAGPYSDDVAAGMAKLQAAGLLAAAPSDADKGAFRTKSLRQIAETAPYMHDGAIADLAAVVEFYDQGGGNAVNKDPLMQPLGLSASEKSDLVELLKTFTGQPISAELVADTHAP